MQFFPTFTHSHSHSHLHLRCRYPRNHGHRQSYPASSSSSSSSALSSSSSLSFSFSLSFFGFVGVLARDGILKINIHSFQACTFKIFVVFFLGLKHIHIQRTSLIYQVCILVYSTSQVWVGFLRDLQYWLVGGWLLDGGCLFVASQAFLWRLCWLVYLLNSKLYVDMDAAHFCVWMSYFFFQF